ncbi:MAG: hypothetical protein JWM87_743 [Candidatus Eremiobacteraeota bacterium]|nr:hypothetical protein [Candidatus Eremiobacteraeota bacterium]
METTEFSEELVAAVNALGEHAGAGGHVYLASPDANEITLDGGFTHAQLAALVAAWKPAILCEDGHRQVNDGGPVRRICFCGKPVVR